MSVAASLASQLERRVGIRASTVQIERALERLGHASPMIQPDLWQRFVELVANNESSFFREPAFFRLFEEELRRVKRTSAFPFRVLSIGCAAGQEIFSCAIVAHRLFGANFPKHVELEGVDVDGAVIDQARSGSYSQWDLRGVTPDVFATYFEPQERGRALLRCEILSSARFKSKNVLDPDASLGSGSWDCVLMRNLLVHFCPSARSRAVTAAVGALRVGGILAVASVEVPVVSESDLNREEFGDFFFFRRGISAENQHFKPPIVDLLCSKEKPVRVAFVSEESRIRDCFSDYAAGRFNEAISVVHSMRSSASFISAQCDGDLWTIEGLCCIGLGLDAQARRALERACVLSPLSWIAHFQFAELLSCGADAIEHYERAVRCLNGGGANLLGSLYVADFDHSHFLLIIEKRLRLCKERNGSLTEST